MPWLYSVLTSVALGAVAVWLWPLAIRDARAALHVRKVLTTVILLGASIAPTLAFVLSIAAVGSGRAYLAVPALAAGFLVAEFVVVTQTGIILRQAAGHDRRAPEWREVSQRLTVLVADDSQPHARRWAARVQLALIKMLRLAN
jgi:hypothetical protein